MVRRSEGSQSITAAIKGKPRAGEGKKTLSALLLGREGAHLGLELKVLSTR